MRIPLPPSPPPGLPPTSPARQPARLAPTLPLLLAVAILCAGLTAPRAVRGGVRSTAFAEFDPGPRVLAMGGAAVAGVADPSAAYWNPAGLYFMRGRQAQVSYDDLYGLGLAHRGWIGLANKRSHDEPVFQDGRLALVPDGGRGNAWALSISSLFLDLGTESYSELAPGFSLAGGFGRDLSFGVTLQYLRASSSLDGVSASGYNATVGIMAGLPGPARAGLSVRNLLSNVSWKDRPSDTLGLMPTLGVEWPLPGHGLLRGDCGWLDGDSGLTRWSLGAEYWLWPGHLAGRAGLRHRAGDVGFDARTEPTFGVGLRWDALDFDYALTSDADGLGTTHRLGLNLLLARPSP